MASLLPLAGGVIGGIGSIIGGGKQASAARDAASIQAAAADRAIQAEQAKFLEGENQLLPFIQAGQAAIPGVQALTGTGPGATASTILNAPLTSTLNTTYPMFTPTVEGVKSAPGYQTQEFIGQTTLKNQLAAQGLRLGGAFGTQLAQFETGLNLGTWQQQQNAYLQNVQQQQANTSLNLQQRAQQFNMANALTGMGATAGTSLLGAAVNTGGQIGQTQLAQGASLASGTVGAANALAGGITGATGNVSNALTLYALSQGMYGPNPAGGANPYGYAGSPASGYVVGSDPLQA